MMKQYKLIPLGMTFMASLVLGACSQDELAVGGLDNYQDSNLILFEAKGDNVVAGTRAADQGEITYLPTGTRFALRLYYDNQNTAGDHIFNTTENAYMQVSSSPSTKRCIYTDNYDVESGDDDSETAPKFYWNNRKFHGFVGYFLNNKAKDDTPTLLDKQNKNITSFVVDLADRDIVTQTVGDKIVNDTTYTATNNDPMLAVKMQQPTSGNNTANRVYLVFEHQASFVEVNVNTDKVSVEPIPEGGGESGEKAVVTEISLLGTNRHITVYTHINDKGEVINENDEVVTDSIGPKEEELKHVCYSLPLPVERMSELPLLPLYSKYSESKDEQDKVKPNYNATASGLAFGSLEGIGIKWEERRTSADEDKNTEVVVHNIKYQFKEGDKPKSLKLLSGKKYIYNITLRRGTIATINLEIVDWKDDAADDYKADGIIVPQETEP